MNISRKVKLFLVRSLTASLAAPVLLFAAGSPVPASTYSISGNSILKDGMKFEGRGGDKLQGGAPETTAKTWGMDILRIPIDMKAQTNAQIQTLVSNARAQGMVAMIDAHWYDNQDMGGTLPWNVAQLTGTNPSSHPHWADILTRWQQLANLFKNQSDVWFDVYNEPYWWDGTQGYSDNLWASDMATLINNIRNTGATNIICVPGSNAGQGWQVIVNRGQALIAGRGNIMFTIHCYTTQGWNTNAATVQSQLQAITNLGLALNIGEYGAETSGANVPAVLAGAAAAQVGAIAWSWNCGPSEVLASDCATPNPVNNYGPEVLAYCSAPRFTQLTTVSPATVAPGGTVAITTTILDAGGALTNGIADQEVYNSSGAKVGQQSASGQNWTNNQQHVYTYNWTAPSTPGVYSPATGVFNSTWGTCYFWAPNTSSITVAAGGDTAQYNFESGTQSWSTYGAPAGTLTSSTSQHFAGTHSLAVAISGTGAGTADAHINAPGVAAGKVVTFHVWVPTGSKIDWIQPNLEGVSPGFAWTGAFTPIANVVAGAWNTYSLTVPASGSVPLTELGVQFHISAAWSGTCYVDTVSW